MTCSVPHHLLALIEVLSHDPRPNLRQDIIDMAADVVPHLSVDRPSRLCNAVGRMRVRSGKLPAIIEAHVLEILDKLTDLNAVKNVAQYLTTARSGNDYLMSVLIGRLHSRLKQAVTPGPLRIGFGCPEQSRCAFPGTLTLTYGTRSSPSCQSLMAMT